MKATGIVRRIDDLGRIVLPKEIRKTLRIKEGDPLEIYVEKDEVLLKKYSPILNLSEITADLSKSINKVTGYSVIITDTESVISAEGEAKDLLGDALSKEAVDAILNNKSFAISETENLTPIKISNKDDSRFKSQLIVPIVTKKQNAIGLIALLDTNGKTLFGSAEIRLLKLSSTLISFKAEV